MTGKEFGCWTVMGRAGKAKGGEPTWLCKCKCGKRKEVRGISLKSGKSKSCGCGILKWRNYKSREREAEQRKKLYEVWKGVRRRTCDEKLEQYRNYGGRGIGICEEWKKDFEAFFKWAMENGYEEGLSIDRKDNEKGYFPDNCRWATRKEQGNNTRRNKLITYGGETHTVTEWEDILHLGRNTLKMRLYKGWNLESAIETPSLRNKK